MKQIFKINYCFIQIKMNHLGRNKVFFSLEKV